MRSHPDAASCKTTHPGSDLLSSYNLLVHSPSEPTDPPPKNPRNHPVNRHQDLIPHRHRLGQVRAAPDDPGDPSPEAVGLALVDGFPAAEVGQRAPVAETEGVLCFGGRGGGGEGPKALLEPPLHPAASVWAWRG